MESSKLVNIDFSMAIQIINFLILVLFFNKFFAKKIGKLLEDRKDLALSEMKMVQEEYSKLEEQKKLAERLKTESKRRANDILIKSEEQADAKKDQIISSAMMNRERMMRKAEVDIEKMRTKARLELEQEVGKMAVELAEKIVMKNITEKQDEIIDNFIEKI